MSEKKPKIHIASPEEVDKYAQGAAEAPEATSASAEGPAQAEPVAAGQEPAAAGEQPSAAELAGEIARWKDKYLRAKADYQNLLARTSKEKSESVRFANAELARSLLTVLDDLERAFAAAKSAGAAEVVVEGVRIVYEHFQKVLTDCGVEPIEAQGQGFDPFLHEAIAQEPSAACPAGAVLRVEQRGYRMRERVLRPARVVVSGGVGTEGAGGPEEAGEEGSSGQEGGGGQESGDADV